MSWIEFFRPNKKSSFRLFCCHYSGGGASLFYQWPSKLPESIELGAIQLPGHETRFDECLLTNMKSVIEGLINDFRYYIDKPFLLFGHSMGAMVCFELTRQLNKLGLPLPIHIIASGCRAPHIPPRREPIYNLPEEDFISKLLMYNGISKKIINENPDLLKVFLPIIRADFSIFDTYRYVERDPLNCEITAISGQDDHLVEEDDIKEWGRQTSRNFHYYSIPGDHLFVKSNQEGVLNIVRKTIENIHG